MCHSATRHKHAQKPRTCTRAAVLVSASVVRQGRQELFSFLPLFVRTRYGTSTMSTQPLSTQDVVFRKALVALPQALRDALAEAELDDPGLLRAYPRSTVTQLGIGDHAPPLDLRRRLTKKGGGGSGMAEAGTDLDTAVDTGLDTVCMGRMAGGTDTLPAGSMDYRLSPVPSRSSFLPRPPSSLLFLLLSPVLRWLARPKADQRQWCRARVVLDRSQK